MTALPTKVVDRFAKVCGLLGGHQDGERSAAGHQATKILHAVGLIWCELIEAAGPCPAEHYPVKIEPNPPGTWRDKLKTYSASSWRLSEWERSFVANLRRRNHAPTEKQMAVLDRLYLKVTS